MATLIRSSDQNKHAGMARTPGGARGIPCSPCWGVGGFSSIKKIDNYLMLVKRQNRQGRQKRPSAQAGRHALTALQVKDSTGATLGLQMGMRMITF
ncbi:MAG TPA: hypothetical protein PKZ83_10610 [bacterium]|nr:hypothetical protein [bacterium]HQJ65549.1 hypothetical protein [bacterium]